MLEHDISYLQASADLVASSISLVAPVVFNNICANIKRLESAKRASALFGAFQGVPAIICGAGPSLEAHREQLQLMENHALIFAGGSALNALQGHLTPHFGASFDPATPIERIQGQSAFPIPFFYQNRVSSLLLEEVKGVPLWVADNNSLGVESFFREELALEDAPFDSGWTVVNFCTALAYELGCNPIIFVGVDFTSIANQKYASGVAQIEERGEKKDWLLSKEWTERFVTVHPERLFLRAHSQGLQMQGISHLSLADICSSYLQQTWSLKEKITQHVAKIQTGISHEARIEELLSFFKCSKARCKLLCDQLISWHEHKPSSCKGEFILMRYELEEELFYHKFLLPIWEVWRPIFESQVAQEDLFLHQLLFLKSAMEELVV